MFIPGPQGKVDRKQFMSPVGAQRHCWVWRVSKQCIAMYDRENGGNFVACARLVSKMKRDKCWRFYKSPQALACKNNQLTKDARLGYCGKLKWVCWPAPARATSAVMALHR
jgi:hypothetical protein